MYTPFFITNFVKENEYNVKMWTASQYSIMQCCFLSGHNKSSRLQINTYIIQRTVHTSIKWLKLLDFMDG